MKALNMARVKLAKVDKTLKDITAMIREILYSDGEWKRGEWPVLVMLYELEDNITENRNKIKAIVDQMVDWLNEGRS